MSQRFDLCVPKPSNGPKPFWVKVGAAFLKDGKLSIKLDTVPVGMVSDRNGNAAPWDGWLVAFDKSDDGRQTSRSDQSGGTSSRKRATGDLDDEIPY